MVRVWAAPLCALMMIVASCGSSNDDTAASETTTTTVTTVTTVTTESTTTSTVTAEVVDDTTTTLVGEADVDLSDGPEVVLLDAGAEPRSTLRLQIADGQTETLSMTQVQELKQTLDGQDLPSTGPIGMMTTMEVDATSLGGDLLEVRSVVTDMSVADDVDPTIATTLQANLNAARGLTTIAVMDDRGRILSSEIEGLSALDPTTAALTEQLGQNNQIASPLPAEPVGVGATWQVTQELELSGLEVTQVGTYEVISIEGSVVRLGVGFAQSVPDGAELVTGGVAAAIEVWDVVGSGSLTLDLTSMIPNSTSEVFGTQKLTVGTESLDQTISTTITFGPG